MKKLLAIILCLALVLSASACGGKTNNSSQADTKASGDTQAPAPQDKQVTIKFSMNNPSLVKGESDESSFSVTFKEYVESHSDTIKVDLYPGSQLGPAQDAVAAISANTIEMGIYELSYLNNYDPKTMCFSTPGFFKDPAEVNKIMDSDWAKNLLAESAKIHNIMVLGATCKGMRCFTCSGKELRTVDDIKGLTIRVMDSPLYTKMVSCLSANPQPMAWSEVYVALQNHVIDGQENPISNYINEKLYEVQDWCVLDNHAPCIVMYMINKQFYEGLSDAQRKVIDEAIEISKQAARETADTLTKENVAALEAKGMTIYQPTDDELAAWQAAYADECAKYVREQVGDEVMDGMEKALAEVRK